MDTKAAKILFVDDDKFLLDMYALKFSKNNFEGFLDDSDYISKYKNAEDIKKELKQLGY